MGRMKSFCLGFFSIFCLNLSCQALIVETNEITRILNHATENSLYVFDLDNTLIEPHQHLGSDQWVTYMVEDLTKKGFSTQQALEQVIPCLLEIHKRGECKLVDDSIPDLLEKLKKKKISFIGLTKREPLISSRTLEQLDRLKIEFFPSIALEAEYTFENLKGTLYKKGIIFVASGVDKGPSLLAYLKKLKKMPSQIVVIDDKITHINNIASVIEPIGIPFIGVRYGAVDEKVKAFNPKIADLQLEYFHKILSDEEALNLLQMKQESLKDL